MTEDRLPLADLLAKAGDGNFLRSVAEAVLQMLMEADVEGQIGAGRHERTGGHRQLAGLEATRLIDRQRTPGRSSPCGDPADLGPHLERARPCGTIVAGGDVVPAKMKEVVDPVVGGKEALRLAGRLEPLHPSFSSSCRLMRVLSTVVQPLVLAVLDGRHHLLLRGAVACQLVGDHDPWWPHLPLQQLPE